MFLLGWGCIFGIEKRAVFFLCLCGLSPDLMCFSSGATENYIVIITLLCYNIIIRKAGADNKIPEARALCYRLVASSGSLHTA